MRDAMKKNKRNMGIIIILVGVGILFISIFFSSGYHSKRNFIGNMYRMEIVLDLGKWKRFFSSKKGPMSDEEIFAEMEAIESGEYYNVGKIAIPLKYLLTFSVVLILFGTGIVLISKNK
jgi:hypothetical protein